MASRPIWGADLKAQKIINLADGSAASDAATFGQVQAALRGLDIKEPVRAATTANITLSGLQTIDGVALAAGDRVLVKNQTAGAENGIYLASATAWTRGPSADVSAEVSQGLSVAVLEGTNKGTGAAVANPVQYVLTTAGAITLGTTALNFALVGSAATGTTYTAGTGITITGSTIAVSSTYAGAAKRYSIDLPATTSGSLITVTHNLNTKDVIWQIVEVSSGIVQDIDFVAATVNTITGSFPVSITAGQYRITVVG